MSWARALAIAWVATALFAVFVVADTLYIESDIEACLDRYPYSFPERTDWDARLRCICNSAHRCSQTDAGVSPPP